MQAIGYVRVSTVQQATEGVSVEAQWQRIAAWCEAHGYALAAIYIDNGLGGRRLDNRPGLAAALSQAVEIKATVVTYSLSRIARSTIDAISISERLRKAGSDLVSLSEHIDTSTAAGNMVFRMLAVLAEFERDLISERTAGAMRHKRARGEYTGGAAPYGWRVARDGRTLEPHARERVAIRAARRLRAHGVSYRGIGRQLTAAGHRPRSGGHWHAKTVGDLLRAGNRLQHATG